LTADQVETIAAGDYRGAGLDPVEEAICTFAERVVLHAEAITRFEIDTLRALGLDDAAIFDIVLAATARVFFSRANDAIGYEPTRGWLERTPAALGEPVFEALMVGRQFVIPEKVSTGDGS
jgi:alkylhydroperoxidase family enzyme